MQASNTAMVRGRPDRSQSKRWALKICGTRQQSASVGVSPWLKRPGCSARRAS
jgi:hypothetical protein